MSKCFFYKVKNPLASKVCQPEVIKLDTHVFYKKNQYKLGFIEVSLSLKDIF